MPTQTVRLFIGKNRTPQGRRDGEAMVYMVDACAAYWMPIPEAINARSHGEHCLSRPISKEIRKTLIEAPEMFRGCNKGCCITAHSMTYDPATGWLSLQLRDTDKLHGMLDGATTWANTGNVLQTGEATEASLASCYVAMEIWTGVTDEEKIKDMLVARANSVQLDPISKAYKAGAFNTLKEYLEREGSPLRGRINYEMYGDNEYSVAYIARILALFHPDFDSDEPPFPITSLAVSPTRLYKALIPCEGNTFKEKFDLLIPKLPVILDLHDELDLQFGKGFHEAFGKQTKPARNNNGISAHVVDGIYKTYPLTFSEGVSDYHLPKGYKFPLMNGFRHLLQPKGKGLDWTHHPVQFLTKHRAKIIQSLMKNWCDAGTQKTARDNAAYEAVYARVEKLASQTTTEFAHTVRRAALTF